MTIVFLKIKLIKYTLSYSSSNEKESTPPLVNGEDKERQVKVQKVKKVGGVAHFPSKKSSPPATQVRHDAVICIYLNSDCCLHDCIKFNDDAISLNLQAKLPTKLYISYNNYY